MKTEEIGYVIQTIDEWLEEHFSEEEPEKVVGTCHLVLNYESDKIAVAHLKHMIIEMTTMNNFEPDDQLTREKLMRWLGFLQGALWSRGYFSLDKLREMNVVEK